LGSPFVSVYTPVCRGQINCLDFFDGEAYEINVDRSRVIVPYYKYFSHKDESDNKWQIDVGELLILGDIEVHDYDPTTIPGRGRYIF